MTTKVYSCSVDPLKLCVGVKYYVVHSSMYQNHILWLLVCTRRVRARIARKNARGYVCFAAVFFHGGQDNPIQTVEVSLASYVHVPMLTSYEVILFFYVMYT